MYKYFLFLLLAVSVQVQDAYARLLHDRIHEAALLGKPRKMEKLLANATQEEVNDAARTAASNGHLKTLKVIMEHPTALHPTQEGINLTADYGAHFGDFRIVQYLFPRLDQEGVNSLLIEAAGFDDLNLLDYIIHHTIQDVPHPD